MNGEDEDVLSKSTIGALFLDETPQSRMIFGPSATRRLEALSTMTSEAFQNYNPTSKYTYYNSKTGKLEQSNTFPQLSIKLKTTNTTTTTNTNTTNVSSSSPITTTAATGLNMESEVGRGESPKDMQPEDGFEWIDVCRPGELDLVNVQDAFKIHPLTIEDINVRENREKCEIFERYLFICVRSLQLSLGKGLPLQDGLHDPVNLYIILFPNHIISIHADPMTQVRHVLMRLFPLRTILVGIQSDWVMYSLIDDLVDEFEPICSSMEMETDSVDELVLVLSRSDQAEMLRRIGRARRLTTQLQRLLRPKIDILRSLIKKTPDSTIRIQLQTIVYLRDVQDHLLTMLQSLEHSSETLNRAHSNYLAQIAIEQNEHNNHMNIIMKNATVIAAIMLPISAISGIWGMNVPVPGADDFIKYPLPFITISLFMVLVMVIMYVIGRRQKWF